MSFTLRRPRVSPGIRKLLLGLLVLEAAYVASGVWLVRSGRVHAWLNKHPEKRTVTFESAWSVIPGSAFVGSSTRGARSARPGPASVP